MSEPLRYALRTKLTDLLPRLRQTLPLPIDPQLIYMGAFSPQVAKWFVGRVPTTLHHHSVAYRNLLRATARQTIIHFNLTEASKIDDWSDRNPDQPFWVRMEDCPVCPSSKLSPFLLDESVRNDPRLQAWYRSAEKLDTEIRWFHDKIYAIAPLFGNKAEIALAWPEIVRAVPSVLDGAPKPSESQYRRYATRVEAIKESIARLLSPAEAARLTDMLATAVLLPEAVNLQAWIGTSREDE